MEVTLAIVLLAIDALPFHPGYDATLALILGIIACGGAALTAWHPRIGAVIACLGFGGLALLPDNMVGPTLYALMIVILSCAWHEEFWTAVATSAWGYGVSLWLSFRNTTTMREDLQAIVVWLGVYALPWVVGLALRNTQFVERRRIAARAEAQRREIAAELHDNVTHELALITMTAEATRIDPTIDKDDALVDIAAMSRRSSAYVRHMVSLMRAGIASPPLSFSTEIRNGLARLADAGFSVEPEIGDGVDSISPAMSSALGHIAHEAFNNILRHGSPDGLCRVTARADSSGLRATFTNATTTAYHGDDLGITGMRDLAEGLGGTLDTRLSDGRWTVRVSIPDAMVEGSAS
ncbi:sensor histidine kinase [Acidipropionibacterium jensenii]|uniref:sensor histidine kinase n=2 Tax=Propionibacteriaceae TaxID=31957 RepID=UPI0004289C95|nr:histidine kinase [Acidipropionibacterium jensenii]MDN5978257.1 histidine kinase [Acidipropionibacterium jensenii]MDN5996053.1 histidine kinase [Acidipropionibacterium jensenii]MDN6481590.1 histidine kinase [Acidipropionibacterium jensenii]MDN6513210.1 histidine kinase [Acidipropionibacterium jensenii]MDN6592466.1 histidine kinase [Acidipropionibacterium jensenii]